MKIEIYQNKKILSWASFETSTVGVNCGLGSIEDSFNFIKSGWSPQTLSVDSLKVYWKIQTYKLFWNDKFWKLYM